MVLGNGSYIFSSNFNSAAASATDNNLVLDQWLVKLGLLQNFSEFMAYYTYPHSYVYPWK